MQMILKTGRAKRKRGFSDGRDLPFPSSIIGNWQDRIYPNPGQANRPAGGFNEV
jgi:hypothetical protein